MCNRGGIVMDIFEVKQGGCTFHFAAKHMAEVARYVQEWCNVNSITQIIFDVIVLPVADE
jgi:hypothetical protein